MSDLTFPERFVLASACREGWVDLNYFESDEDIAAVNNLIERGLVRVFSMRQLDCIAPTNAGRQAIKEPAHDHG